MDPFRYAECEDHIVGVLVGGDRVVHPVGGEERDVVRELVCGIFGCGWDREGRKSVRTRLGSNLRWLMSYGDVS